MGPLHSLSYCFQWDERSYLGPYLRLIGFTGEAAWFFFQANGEREGMGKEKGFCIIDNPLGKNRAAPLLS